MITMRVIFHSDRQNIMKEVNFYHNNIIGKQDRFRKESTAHILKWLLCKATTILWLLPFRQRKKNKPQKTLLRSKS